MVDFHPNCIGPVATDWKSRDWENNLGKKPPTPNALATPPERAQHHNHTMRDYSPLLNALGIRSPVSRLEQALTHTSYSNEHHNCPNYQRLEFLGDAVLGLCVAELLLADNPNADEGTLSRTRSAIVCTASLARFAKSVDLYRWMNLGKGAVTTGNAMQSKVLADVVEAIVAAVYLEHGFADARLLANRIASHSIKTTPSLSKLDPKSELQELVQCFNPIAPTYRVIAEHGPDNDRSFEVEVLVGDDAIGTGHGRSKKIAEQAAASSALNTILHRKDGACIPP